MIEFDTKISYTCKNGMKFEDDKSLFGGKFGDKVEATCRPGNTWDEPVWLKCVESKIHYTKDIRTTDYSILLIF